MKNILLLFIILYPVVLFSQPASGDGTSGNPYSGVITTPWTLSGDKYCGNLSVSSGTFTIDPGATLRFGTGNSLSFSGSGALYAVGNSSNYITFTASGTTWGHISFDNTSSTAASSISFCIIEKGAVTGSGYTGAGGGILIRHSFVTVLSSIIRNNSSDWGGGIFVDASKSPSINKCLFKDNTTIHAGGGIYFYNGAGSIIENCIFDSNHCTEPSVSYYTGGGIAAQTNCTIKVLNCTFVNNTSTRTEGQGLLLHNSPSSRVINSIFWGASDKQIYCYGTTANVIINDAYRGITYSNGTPVAPVVLNSSNSASDGPNFNQTDGSDWSIKYVSPCRDAGVNSYTGVTIPALDYAGNSRVLTTDIGAYEVQYSRWKTTASTTDWNTAANWDGGVPSTSRDVIVPSGATSYPTGSTSQDFTIGSGKQMIVEPGAKVTLDDLSNSGTLLLKSDATSISSLILGSYSGNDADVELYLTGGPAPVEGNRWHLISSPFMTLSRDPIWAVTNNLAQWVESYDRGDLDEGWIAADGWDYALGSIPGSPTTFTNLNLGQGYTHFYSSNYTYTISGELNTENKSVNIYCTDTDQPLLYGHNLLGNPFSSGLDWDQIVDDGAYPASTSKVLHYRKDGGHVYYINDIGSEPGVNGIIPPMQGFFVKTYAASGSINLAASARVHDNIPTRYKGGEKAFIPLVRLKINTGERYDYAVVRFDELAKTGLDYDFDAVKDFISTTKPTIYTISGGTKFVINGLPFPEESVDIPVAVKLITAGNQTINTTELTGLDSYNLYLIDNETGYMANLRTNPLVTFSSAPGLFTDRFILRISEITTDVENPLDFKTGAFNIYTGFGSLNIQTITDDWDGRQGSVRVLDLSGRTVTSNANVEFSRNSVIQVGAPTVKGLYVVEISSGAKRYVSKVVVSGNR